MNSFYKYMCCSRFFCLIGIGFFLAACGGAPSMVLDESLSASFRNLPYNAKALSEIRVYETPGSNFLSDKGISHLVPIKILCTQDEITALLETMALGRTSNQDLTLRNFHYLPTCYHLIAVNLAGTAYGYLKVQISSDTDKPIVTKVEMPDGSNSFEYMKLLPTVLEGMSAQVKK